MKGRACVIIRLYTFNGGEERGIYRWFALIAIGVSVIAVPEWEQWRELMLIGLVAINGFELEGLRSRVDGDLDTIRVDLDGLRSSVDGDLDLIRDNLNRLTFRDNT